MMTELFIELRTEEIPARCQVSGAESFMNLLCEGLKKNGVQFDTADYYASPRHLALVFRGLPLQTEERIEEKRGPRRDAPAAAIQGFLSANQISREECEERETSKGIFLFAHIKNLGQPLAELLPPLITQAVRNIPWPNSMRWGWGTESWIRPVRGGICIFNDQVLPFSLKFGEGENAPQITFGNTTVGHRFLSPSSFSVRNFEEYKGKLERSCVIVDHRKRRQIITEQLSRKAAEYGLQVVSDIALLEEVTGLVEWPVALMGNIQPEFMALPSEVLKTSMRVHQRYFALQNEEGQMAPHFIVISNMASQDEGKQIILGNERVLNARLSDARFFYEADMKLPLLQMAGELSRIRFHAELGSLADKTNRLQALAGYLARQLQADEAKAIEAASLLKADLVSKMVGEFPELQGIMGKAYAIGQGYSEDIAVAISEHYMPRGSADSIPASLLGQICALADRIDSLVGFFAIHIRPSGSKDPFALRRAALGIIRILEKQHLLDLKEVFAFAYQSYQPVFDTRKDVLPLEQLLKDLQDFMLDRLTVSWREQGLRHDVIKAAFLHGIETPLSLLGKRAGALQDFLARADQSGDNLLKAYRRATNIVQIEEQKDQQSFNAYPDKALLKEPAEISFFEAFTDSSPEIEQALKQHDYATVMAHLAKLRPVIDEYFDKVIVNSPDSDLRSNRLKTLSVFRSTLNQIADFSCIVDI